MHRGVVAVCSLFCNAYIRQVCAACAIARSLLFASIPCLCYSVGLLWLGWLEMIETRLDVGVSEFSKNVFLETARARGKKNIASNSVAAKRVRASEWLALAAVITLHFYCVRPFFLSWCRVATTAWRANKGNQTRWSRGIEGRRYDVVQPLCCCCALIHSVGLV